MLDTGSSLLTMAGGATPKRGMTILIIHSFVDRLLGQLHYFHKEDICYSEVR